jgi:phosphate transport system substrate-binding protein
MQKKWLAAISAVIMAASLAVPGLAEDKSMVQVKGSDTMVHLASAWAEKFMKTNPSIEISVTGGGSGTGISALLNGTCDVANASRTMTDSEKSRAKGRGFEAVEHIVGLDGIAVIVNPANPLKTLTMEQIKKVFMGEVNNWKAVGGPDAKISLFTRDSSSGTFQFFQEHVLRKGDYSVKAHRLASTSAIVQSVSEDTNGIGYVGLGYLTEAQGKVKALSVSKKADSAPVLPSVATVTDGTYPVSRGLQMYTRNQPEGNVKVFMDFVKGAEGQKTVEELGFVKKP